MTTAATTATPAVTSAVTASAAQPDRHVVAVAVTDNAPTFELAVPCEVFGLDRSDISDPWYDLRLCAAEPGVLRTTAGLTLHTPYGLDDLVAADTVVVAAAERRVQTDPPRPLLDALRTAHARGRRIVSLCSGAYVLAAAGLLTGRRATTHWLNAADFAHRFPDVTYEPAALYVQDGTVFTSAGTGAVIDLCLHLVRHDRGSAVANEVARRMVVPPHREGGQAEFVERPVPPIREGARIGPLFDRMRSRLAEEQPVAELAAEAGMSVRTFLRRFKSATGMPPGEWLLAERLLRARELLETTTHSIEDIAAASGFGSPATLRHHFRSRLGTSPAAYRIHFTREQRDP